MKFKYTSAILLLFALLISCSEEMDKSPELSKEEDQFPDLSMRIPYFMERLHSNRWQVRYYLLLGYDARHHYALTGRDAETKRVFEMLIRDENKEVASQALRRYISSFVDIDKTLFKPELYFYGIVGYDFLGPGPVNEEDYDAFVDSKIRSLKAAKLDDYSVYRTLTIVGIMGKPDDAAAVYRFLQSPYDDIAYTAAIAVIRLGDRTKGLETLRRLASWDSSKEPPYMLQALYALEELQDRELEAIVLDGVASIDSSEGIPPNIHNSFLLLAANVTNKDVWNVDGPRNRVEAVGRFPDLPKKIPYFMERLYSNRWKVRYGLLHDLTRRDIETKRILETLMRDEKKNVANQATVRYLHNFVDIDKSLFKPELYFISRPGDEFPEPDLLNEERHDALVEYCLRRLDTAQLDDPSMYRNLTVVGILGKPGDAEALYPFLESTNSYVAIGATKAVVRLGERKKGMEAFRRRVWDLSKNPFYSSEALYALKEMQDPDLEGIVNKILGSIDQIEGLGPEWLNSFLLFAADVTDKDVWNVEEPQNKPDAGGDK
ncbi:MAG: hypothetical protein JSU85_09320 [Candidatus Zixiibacteriota bacterium]|nr:MAG: hypothetical protein JSU85_09320 [candidate division Zixibacteria bacterium]